jgi:hypothetical protein
MLRTTAARTTAILLTAVLVTGWTTGTAAADGPDSGYGTSATARPPHCCP